MTFPTTTPELPIVHVDRTWIDECGKCSSTGTVSWGQADTGVIYIGEKRVEVPKVCYDCHGLGFTTDTLRKETRRTKDRARREAKAAAKWAAGQAARDEAAETETARRAEWAATHADVVAHLAVMPGEFAADLQRALAENGDLNPGAVAAVLADLANRTEGQPVPTGRAVVTGEIVGTKIAESYIHGMRRTTLKMIVLDDRGFKVFGTFPTSLDAHKGDRVTFTAMLQPSDDDPMFGFYSRPTKAAALVAA